MPFAMPQYAALLQSAASMAVAKKAESEKRQKISVNPLFEQSNKNGIDQTNAVKVFQQFLAQQVRSRKKPSNELLFSDGHCQVFITQTC